MIMGASAAAMCEAIRLWREKWQRKRHPVIVRPPHVASAFALPATADGSLMRAACCPFSTRTARFGSWLPSTTEQIFDRGNFLPFWLIAGITGIVEIGTSGHRHVLRASCRS
jgi:hypothetical protein